MRYQWGRKDPYAFATNSQMWGIGVQYGKYPVKIYTIDGVLIYQENNGGDNKDKQPAGGIIALTTAATSEMETIKNPTTFYLGSDALINQIGQTRNLWDYYWTSYSRGTDGTVRMTDWFASYNTHNDYLDEYTYQRLKSIYDPCPYGYRTPTNGVYDFEINHPGWVSGSYTGGLIIEQNSIKTWYISSGWKISKYEHVGTHGFFRQSTCSSPFHSFNFAISCTKVNGFTKKHANYSKSTGFSVRCIEVSPPRPTGETHLAMVVSIPVSKTVTLVVCSINGDVKIRLPLQLVAKQEWELFGIMVSIL